MTELFRPDGLLLIDKPAGISSFGVIEKLQDAWKAKTGLRKKELPSFGHGGTLDPFATGLLLLCVGRGVKLSRYFLEGGFKTYEAELKFGEKTSSGDCSNPVIEKNDRIPSDENAMIEAARSFTSSPYLQIPPMYSAKKIDGKRLYEHARKGNEVEREPRECHVRRFEVLKREGHSLRFVVEASSGTFIRTLAEDFAAKLGAIAHLTSLKRTHSGPYSLENALTLQQWIERFSEGASFESLPAFIPIDRMLDHFTKLEVNAEERLWLRTGLQAEIPRVLKRLNISPFTSENRVIFKHHGELVGVAVLENNTWSIERIVPIPGSPSGV